MLLTRTQKLNPAQNSVKFYMRQGVWVFFASLCAFQILKKHLGTVFNKKSVKMFSINVCFLIHQFKLRHFMDIDVNEGFALI